MQNNTTAGLAALAAFGLAACDNSARDTTSDDPIERANPAAVYCAERGGEYILASGECRLRDGTLVDAWDYYREMHPAATDE